MKGIWKWILIAGGALVIIGCLGAAAVFSFTGLWMPGRYMLRMPMFLGPRFGQRLNPDQGFGPGLRMFSDVGRGPWVIVLICGVLLFIALVAVGLYLALRHRPQPAAPVVPVAPPPPAPMPCPHCGQQVQAGWVACPYCGEKLTTP